MSSLDALTWPITRLGDALHALAWQSGLAPRPMDIPSLPDEAGPDGDETLGHWMEAAAASAGLEADRVETSYAEVDRFVRSAGPALLRLPGESGARFLALAGGGRRAVSILGPNLAMHSLRPQVLRAALCQPLETPLAGEVARLLAVADVPQHRQERARETILRERLGPMPIGSCWLLRLPPGGSFRLQVSKARLLHLLLGLFVVQTLEYFLWLLSWWMVGRGALSGRLDRGWLLSWALLLLTLIPFRLLATWWEGAFAVRAGALLKCRLLSGALRLEPEEIRHQGVGQLLGRVLEAEAVESLALGGGFLALAAAIELVMAAGVLSLGSGGALHAVLLLGWVVLAVALGWRYFSHRLRWVDTRLEMTHDLVERMVGHRTRQAQERRERWHDSEDQALERYLGMSQVMDGRAVVLTALVPRGWLIVGLIGLAPGFVTGSASPEFMAVGLGGVLLAHRALRKLAQGAANVAGAAIAWNQTAPIFHAASRPEARGVPSLALPQARELRSGATLLEAHEIVFRHRGRGEPILKDCSLRISVGDRLLVEGPSGAGKSTLVSLLIGLRVPDSGLLLLGGFDQRSLGSPGWRRRIVAAPQFHENHVLAAPFAFNLLMGRPWPTRPEEFDEVEAVCRELGLGELLDRMPAGLMQMVGETGWQLSHGERSRLYIARALLQRADVVLLDESFAALDPENLARALRCVLRRTRTLLVVAHP